jgi:hypothetical protein
VYVDEVIHNPPPILLPEYDPVVPPGNVENHALPLN